MGRTYFLSTSILAFTLVPLLSQGAARCPAFDLFGGPIDTPPLGSCDQTRNYAECDYSEFSCCGTGDQCVDPASPLFNATAASCTSCTVPVEPLFDLGFCNFYTVLPRRNLMLATNLCSQTEECGNQAATVYACLLDSVGAFDSCPPGAGVNRLELVESCFSPTPCSSTYVASLVSSICGIPPAEMPLNTETCSFANLVQSPTNFVNPLDVTAAFSNGECDLTLNSPRCGLDGGSCCAARPEDIFLAPPGDYSFSRPACNEADVGVAAIGGQYPQVRSCLDCLGSGILDLEDATLCAWTSRYIGCIRDKCSRLTDNPEIAELVILSEVLELVCASSSEVCTPAQARSCVVCEGFRCGGVTVARRLFTPGRNMQGFPVEECELEPYLVCFEESGCESSVIKTFLKHYGISKGRNPDAIIAECAGCFLEPSISIIGAVLPRKCELLQLDSAVNPVCDLGPRLQPLLEDPNAFNDFGFRWELTYTGELDSAIEFVPGSFAGIPLYEKVGSNIRAKLRVNSLSVPTFRVSRIETIDVELTAPSVVVDITSGPGGLIVLDASKTCIPDRIGCDLCPPTGFTGVLPSSLAEIMAITGLTADFVISWGFSIADASTPIPPKAGDTMLQRSIAIEEFGDATFITVRVSVESLGRFVGEAFVEVPRPVAEVSPACSEAALRLYSKKPTEVSAVDGTCDIENNIAACGYDDGACCRDEAFCVDPESPLASEGARQCMDCYNRGSQSFCEFFQGLQGCLIELGCGVFSDVSIPEGAQFIANDLCEQDRCSDDAAERTLDCIYNLLERDFLVPFADDPCVLSSQLEECFVDSPTCEPRVIKRYFEASIADSFRADCEGQIESLEVQRCRANAIANVDQLSGPTTIAAIREEIGNGDCNPVYNIEECNFDGGDCCSTFEAGSHLCVDDNAYSSKLECQQCYSNGMLDLDNPYETLCPYTIEHQRCVDAKCFGFEDASELGPVVKLCEAPGCDAAQVSICYFDSLTVRPRGRGLESFEPALNGQDLQPGDGQTGPRRHLQGECADFTRIGNCFLGTTCPRSLLFDGTFGIAPGEPDEVPGLCYGCDASSFARTVVTAQGSRICDDVRISVRPKIERTCARGLDVAYGQAVDSSALRYFWNVGDLPSFPQQEDRSFVFKPYEAGHSRFPTDLPVSVRLDAGFLVEPIPISEVYSLEPSNLVAQTSEVGTIVVFSGSAGVPELSINSFRSCDPDKVGCALCTANGFQGMLRESLVDILLQTGMTSLSSAVIYKWDIECEGTVCVNEEIALDRSVLRIPNDQLSPEASPYRVTLQIQRGVEAPAVRAAPILVEVVDGSTIDEDCEVPTVSISSDKAATSVDLGTGDQVLVINDRQRSNLLRGSVFSKDGTPVDIRGADIDLEWSFRGSVVASGRLFAIDNELFSDSPPYTFTLTARQSCTAGADPYARITLRKNLPPSGGTLSVSPTSGDSLNTLFSFTASAWTDPESHLPLKYAFFADNNILRRPSVASTAAGIVLSGSGNVPTFVRVSDFLGGAADSEPVFVNLRSKPVEEIESTVFDTLAREGADDEELINYVNGVIKLVNGEKNESLLGVARELRKAAFNTLKDTADSRRNESASTLDDIARTTKTLKEVLSDPEQLDREDYDEFAGFFKDLLDDTAQEDLDSAIGGEGELFEDVLEGASTLLLALVRGASGRRLQAGESTCNIIGSLRDVVKDVGLVVTKDDASGAFVRTVNASGVRLAATTSPGDEIGSLSLGDVTVEVPSDIGAGSGDLTTIVSQFEFNIRACDDTEENLLDAVTSESECVESLNATADSAPVKPPENVISVEFRSTLGAGGAIAVEPTDLDDPIVLTLPLGDLDIDDNGICSNFTELTCGFYSETDGEFSTDGCNVTNVDVAAGTIECTCNHASDYAAWVAFQQDVIDVFSKPLSVITLLGIILATAVVASVFTTYCLCSAWGNHRDNTTARALQKEAVGVMLLNRFLLRQRQRQFFLNLKEAVEAGKQEGSAPPLPTKKREASLCKRMITAIRYEHSLLGLVRYDPHYTRVQRVSIFTAVVLGNLFIAAVFFELKDSEVDDLSPGFILLVVLVSSLAVAIPIRLIIKMLFRITDYRSGSNADRIAQLYRVSLAAERDFQLVMNSPKDVELIQAFKDVYLWKERVRNLGGARANTCCCRSPPGEEEEEEKMPADGGEGGENITVSLASKLARANEQLHDAQERLKKATIAAKEDWKLRSNGEALQRVQAVNRQKSRLMQVTALLAEDASASAKARRALCPHWVVYVSWTFLLALYGLAVFYVIRFVLSRADRAALPTVTRTENELVGVWLVSASLGILVGYCIAEPLIAVARYACLPYCLLKCGTSTPEVEEEEEEEDDVFKESSTDFYASMKALDIKAATDEDDEAVKERNKKAAESTRGRFVLEIISDLIATIY